MQAYNEGAADRGALKVPMNIVAADRHAAGTHSALVEEQIRFDLQTQHVLASQGDSFRCLHFSICARHPCAGAMLVFSVSFQF